MSVTAPPLRLYNTLTRSKEVFTPIDPAHVRMYVCGPTVYDYAHIGNARPVIVFDVLYRLLRHLYGKDHVTYVRNITDVDDKINARAARDFPGLPLNEAIRKVTTATEDQFHADTDALGCLRPDYEPRATEHIDEMRQIIETLVAKGFAYVAEGHVLFSPAAMDAANGVLPRYGKLANRSLDEMIAGARVDVAPYKRDATDFVLWKPSSEGEPGWPSPCGIDGNGRPGWHIECSAMSWRRLVQDFAGRIRCDAADANVFDIHGGGIDLVFPHHENEIAQSCCAFGSSRMANVWMHNGFLQVEGEKMSKSLGNFVTINEHFRTQKFGGRRWPGEVLRLVMLKTHYTQPIDWTVAALDEAFKNLSNWYSAATDLPAATMVKIDDEFLNILCDDVNSPRAIARLHVLYSALRTGPSGLHQIELKRQFTASANLLGLLQLSQDEWRNIEVEHLNSGKPEVDEDKIKSLIAARLEARKRAAEFLKNNDHSRAKDCFAESDRIRDELAAMGIQLKDGKDPVTGEPVTTWEVKR